jgi:predicted O-methyltransferase YrrM
MIVRFTTWMMAWVAHLLRSLARLKGRVGQGLRQRLDGRIARTIANAGGYQFTVDYGRCFRSNGEQYLSPLRGVDNLRILEIGSAEGQSTVWFLDHLLTHAGATITCIDPFYPVGSEPRFDHNIRISGQGGKVRKIKGRSEMVLPTLDGEQFDIIYIDGNHRAGHVLLDAMFCWRMLKPAGILMFDDYEWEPHRSSEERPQMAIDIFLEILGSQLTILHKGYQVIIQKRRSTA